MDASQRQVFFHHLMTDGKPGPRTEPSPEFQVEFPVRLLPFSQPFHDYPSFCHSLILPARDFGVNAHLIRPLRKMVFPNARETVE
jgi:hypothetical protein